MEQRTFAALCLRSGGIRDRTKAQQAQAAAQGRNTNRRIKRSLSSFVSEKKQRNETNAGDN